MNTIGDLFNRRAMIIGIIGGASGVVTGIRALSQDDTIFALAGIASGTVALATTASITAWIFLSQKRAPKP